MKKPGDPGLYAAIHAKQERIKAGSGEKMRKPGSPGAPTTKDFKQSAKNSEEKIMPIKSKSQERLMQGVAHSPEFAKKVGIKQSIGKEFVSAGPAKKKLPEKVAKKK